jgi:uncharacterized protein YoxC
MEKEVGVIASFWSAFGSTAAIISAVAWAVLVGFLGLMLVNVFRVLESTKMMIDDLRKETVPLLHEVTGTVTGVNKELDRVDVIVESAGHIVRNVERISGVVEQTISSPLIKVAALGAGLARAGRKVGKKGREG